MELKAIIHKAKEGGYWAEIPSLPGCCSQGDSKEELIENLLEASRGVLEILKEEGRSPEPEIEVVELSV